MTHLEVELKQLEESILNMMKMVERQLEKSKDAFNHKDTEIAQEIIHHEKRVNALELSIDRDCENILALFNPVATNLRFVISVLKINSDLERIADYAKGIADYVVDDFKLCKAEVLETVKIKEMFEIALSMTHDIGLAFEKKDTKLARKVYYKDKELNAINKNAVKLICGFVKKDPAIIQESLYLFSTIKKLERVGDHIKNIAEDLIFFQEAEVVKHNKSKL
jgi:phosphate transport system protein